MTTLAEPPVQTGLAQQEGGEQNRDDPLLAPLLLWRESISLSGN